MGDETLRQWGMRAVWFVALAASGYVILVVLGHLYLVVVPLVLAALPGAALSPLASRLKGLGVPGALVAIALELALIAVVVLAVWLVVPGFLDQLPDLRDSLGRSISQIDVWLNRTSIPIPIDSLESLWNSLTEGLGSGSVLNQGLTIAGMVSRWLAGFGLGIVALFLYLQGGTAMWRGFLATLPRAWRPLTDEAGTRVWSMIGDYMRGQFLVACIDATLIGLGLWLLAVPLALPLAVLVFLGGFFPVVGALVSGLVAVLVALADQGLTQALLVLALIVAVQQIEGNVLQPFIMGNVIRLNPLLLVAALTAGGALLGLLGAFVAVPITAAVARVVELLRERAARPGEEEAEDGADIDLTDEAEDQSASGRERADLRGTPPR